MTAEALNRVIDYLFKEVGFNRVYGYHSHADLASDKVMQKMRHDL